MKLKKKLYIKKNAKTKLCQIKPHDSDIENRHSTSISDCGVWGVRVGIQVFKRKFHTHIHLD